MMICLLPILVLSNTPTPERFQEVNVPSENPQTTTSVFTSTFLRVVTHVITRFAVNVDTLAAAVTVSASVDVLVRNVCVTFHIVSCFCG